MRATDVMVNKSSDSVEWIAANGCVSSDKNVKGVAEGRRFGPSHVQLDVPFVSVDECLPEMTWVHADRFV